MFFVVLSSASKLLSYFCSNYKNNNNTNSSNNNHKPRQSRNKCTLQFAFRLQIQGMLTILRFVCVSMWPQLICKRNVEYTYIFTLIKITTEYRCNNSQFNSLNISILNKDSFLYVTYFFVHIKIISPTPFAQCIEYITGLINYILNTKYHPLFIASVIRVYI